MSRTLTGPITLHLDPDEEPYDEYPKVGIIARATLTVNTGTTEQPFFHVVALESRGVWGIECPDLVAGCSIPEDSWVTECYGNDQIKELQDLIDFLTNTGGES